LTALGTTVFIVIGVVVVVLILWFGYTFLDNLSFRWCVLWFVKFFVILRQHRSPRLPLFLFFLLLEQ
jgi:hypothetical protein